jgi:hypothetical protein
MLGNNEDAKMPIANGPVRIAGVTDEDVTEVAVQITFADDAVLTGTYWRLIVDEQAVLSSFDHGQQYGLPAPIDAIAELAKELEGHSLNEVRLDKETADVVLSFAGRRKLQVFNFTGYEIWNIQFPDGRVEYSNHVLK